MKKSEKSKRAKLANLIMQAPLAVWMIAFVLAPFALLCNAWTAGRRHSSTFSAAGHPRRVMKYPVSLTFPAYSRTRRR